MESVFFYFALKSRHGHVSEHMYSLSRTSDIRSNLLALFTNYYTHLGFSLISSIFILHIDLNTSSSMFENSSISVPSANSGIQAKKKIKRPKSITDKGLQSLYLDIIIPSTAIIVRNIK